MTWRTEQRARSLREAEARVTCSVARAAIRFGLDDARNPYFSGDSRFEISADERACNDACVALVEGSR